MSNILSIGILADDLTSATDGAVPFAERGWPCLVALHPAADTLRTGDAQLVSIDKESRVGGPLEAANRSAQGARMLRSFDVLYHTVDSTIRGHLEAEILAALDASERKAALLAPAFPGAGRTTRNGVQLLNGIALHETDFRFDPTHPITRSAVRACFPNVPDPEIGHLSLAMVRALAPGSLSLGTPKILIADAEEQADLDRLVDAIAVPQDVLFCGSPGMAYALARRLGHGDLVAEEIEIEQVARVLTVVGSVNPASLIQRDALIAAQGAVRLLVDAKQASIDPEQAAIATLKKVDECSLKAASVVLGVTAQAQERGDPVNIARALSICAARLHEFRKIDGLVLTGGDTAAAVLGAIGIESMTVLRELEAGIPLCLAREPKIAVVTKAGGFGGSNCLVDIVRWLSLQGGDRA